jgi:hypothetical protein
MATIKVKKNVKLTLEIGNFEGEATGTFEYDGKSYSIKITEEHPSQTDTVTFAPKSEFEKLKISLMKEYLKQKNENSELEEYRINLEPHHTYFLNQILSDNVPEDERKKRWEEAIDKLMDDRELTMKFIVMLDKNRAFISLSPRRF